MAALLRNLLQLMQDALRPRLPEPRPEPSAGIALALGGGFARGFAHIGVLQVLEEARIPIAGIAGTSVGSILGAAYASGVPLERISEVCRGIRLKHIARWRISRMGLASNDRLGEIIRRWFAAQTFEQLRIPLAVVASDLGRGEPHVFTRGPLVEAIRASCAFPGLFEPVEVDGRCLADGGLVAPVPAQAARRFGARCVVGVSVCFKNWNGRGPCNVFQVVSRAISVAQRHSFPMWERFADLVIEPEVRSIEWDAFDRADEAIAAGAAAARRALPRLRELLDEPERAQSPRVMPMPRAACRAER